MHYHYTVPIALTSGIGNPEISIVSTYNISAKQSYYIQFKHLVNKPCQCIHALALN